MKPHIESEANLIPGLGRRLAPVIKCRRFLLFFQRYIVRIYRGLEIYRWLVTFGSARWLIEIFSAILKSTRHGGQSRGRLMILSKRVFETRTVTGSELFSLLTCPLTTTFTILSIFFSIRNE